jgi:hypothetical protein
MHELQSNFIGIYTVEAVFNLPESPSWSFLQEMSNIVVDHGRVREIERNIKVLILDDFIFGEYGIQSLFDIMFSVFSHILEFYNDISFT